MEGSSPSVRDKATTLARLRAIGQERMRPLGIVLVVRGKAFSYISITQPGCSSLLFGFGLAGPGLLMELDHRLRRGDQFAVALLLRGDGGRATRNRRSVYSCPSRFAGKTIAWLQAGS